MDLGPARLVQGLGADLLPKHEPHLRELLTAAHTPDTGRSPQELADSAPEPPGSRKFSPVAQTQARAVPAPHPTPTPASSFKAVSTSLGKKRGPLPARGSRTREAWPQVSVRLPTELLAHTDPPRAARSAWAGRAGGRLRTPEGCGAGLGPHKGSRQEA